MESMSHAVTFPSWENHLAFCGERTKRIAHPRADRREQMVDEERKRKHDRRLYPEQITRDRIDPQHM